MSFLRRLVRWLFGPAQSVGSERVETPPRHDPPSPHFPALAVVETTPANDLVAPKTFYVVVASNEPYWAMFRCPCGCDEVVNLPLRNSHNPRWRVRSGQGGAPTLHPSVWRNRGCLSHFWVLDGQVRWCTDTGQEPWRARPDIYSRPRA